MADYTPEELTEHYVHNVQNEDVIGCRICDAVARQRGSLIDNDQLRAAIPPEARCQIPTPHKPHRHEINWGDLVGGYWCDGAHIDGLEAPEN